MKFHEIRAGMGLPTEGIIGTEFEGARRPEPISATRSSRVTLD